MTPPLSQAPPWLWRGDSPASVSASGDAAHSVRLIGALDLRALEWSIGEVARQHDLLRSAGGAADDRTRAASAAFAAALDVADLRVVPDTERGARVAQLIAEETGRPFDGGRNRCFVRGSFARGRAITCSCSRCLPRSPEPTARRHACSTTSAPCTGGASGAVWAR